MKLENPHLTDLSVDHFHHLGFNTDSPCVSQFADVKFICLSGSAGRAQKFAKFINKELKINADEDEVLKNLCLTDRYVMYKVGPVLAANHGMGVPSLRIILTEIFKLLHYVKASDVTFFRIGTSGGIGLTPGTVVLTKKAVDGTFQPKLTNTGIHVGYAEELRHKQVIFLPRWVDAGHFRAVGTHWRKVNIILGEVKEYNTEFKYSNFDKIMQVSEAVHKEKHFECVLGDTICTDDFYEGQGRIDGAFCKFSKEDRMNYLKKAYDQGVRNFEMECTLFAALCNQAQVSAFVVCVTLLNRFEGDQVLLSKEELHEFEARPFELVLAYIKSTVGDCL